MKAAKVQILKTKQLNRKINSTPRQRKERATPHARGRLEREGDTTVPAERVKKFRI